MRPPLSRGFRGTISVAHQHMVPEAEASWRWLGAWCSFSIFLLRRLRGGRPVLGDCLRSANVDTCLDAQPKRPIPRTESERHMRARLQAPEACKMPDAQCATPTMILIVFHSTSFRKRGYDAGLTVAKGQQLPLTCMRTTRIANVSNVPRHRCKQLAAQLAEM